MNIEKDTDVLTNYMYDNYLKTKESVDEFCDAVNEAKLKDGQSEEDLISTDEKYKTLNYSLISNAVDLMPDNKAVKKIVSVSRMLANEKSFAVEAKREVKSFLKGIVSDFKYHRDALFDSCLIGGLASGVFLSAIDLFKHNPSGLASDWIVGGIVVASGFACGVASKVSTAIDDYLNFDKNVEYLKKEGLYDYAIAYARKVKREYKLREVISQKDEDLGGKAVSL